MAKVRARHGYPVEFHFADDGKYLGTPHKPYEVHFPHAQEAGGRMD